MGYILGVIFVRPLGLILSFIFNLVQNYALSIILFTIIVKLILLPFQYKNKKGMKKMQAINVEAQRIQKKYARSRDKTKMNEEIQALYEREGYNPMSSCLLTFITLPIMMGLYYVVRKPMTYMMGLSEATMSSIASAIGTTFDPKAIYGQIELTRAVHENWDKVGAFVSQGLENIDFSFFGVDLASIPTLSNPSLMWLFPIIAGLTSLGSTLIMQKMQGNNDAMNNPGMKTTMMLMPLMMVWICFSTPAALALYWIVNTVITCIQEFFMTRMVMGKIEKQDAEEAAKTAAEKEAKRLAQQEQAKQQAQEARERQAQLEESRKKNKKKKG